MSDKPDDDMPSAWVQFALVLLLVLGLIWLMPVNPNPPPTPPESLYTPHSR